MSPQNRGPVPNKGTSVVTRPSVVLYGPEPAGEIVLRLGTSHTPPCEIGLRCVAYRGG